MSQASLHSTDRPVITDGAWGTELHRRGLAQGEPADLWNLTRPDDVEAVARLYVEAGSQLLLTNTFRANPIASPKKGTEINSRGVAISRRAGGPSVRVFGSIGPIGKSLKTGEIAAAAVFDAYRLQCRWLADAGADGLVLETLYELDEARLAVCAAKATGLPVVASFVFVDRNGGDELPGGDDPQEVARAMAVEGADAVGANCGAGPGRFAAIVRRMKAGAGLPVWVKPSAGLPSVQAGRAVYAMTPEAFAAGVLESAAAGAAYVGGCCGAGPEFIRALSKALADSDCGTKAPG